MVRSSVRVVLALLVLLQGILAVGRGQHAVVLRECVDHASRSVPHVGSEPHSHGPGDHHHEHRHFVLHAHGDPSCEQDRHDSPTLATASDVCSDDCDHSACACLHLHLDGGAVLIDSSRVTLEFIAWSGSPPPTQVGVVVRSPSRPCDLRLVGEHPPDLVLGESLASIVLRI